jgi:hAT family C-terminal dimerisation region
LEAYCEAESTDDELLMVHDDFSDPTTSFIELQGSYKINCVVHKIQLSVNDFLWKTPHVKNLLNKAIALTTLLKTPIMKLLLEKEGLLQAKGMVVTRWNCAPQLIRRLLSLKEFSEKYNGQENFRVDLTPEEWSNLKTLLGALEIVEKLTTELQAEKLLVSDFVYLLFSVETKLNAKSDYYSKLLLEKLKARKIQIFDNDIILAGWLLHPELKLMLLVSENSETSLSRAKTAIYSLHHKKNTILGIQQDEEVEEVHEESSNVSTQTDPFQKYLAELNGNDAELDKAKQSKQTVLARELAKYESTKFSLNETKNEVLKWWKSQAAEFPVLSSIACDLLCVPVAEVSVERLFSHLKLIMTKHRSTLKGKLLDDILFLRMNQHFQPK